MKLLTQIGFVFVLFLTFLIAPSTQASLGAVEGYIDVPGGHSLYVKYSPPKADMPTLIALHGLTYSIWQWEPFATYLREKGYGVLLYDMYGMGRTLVKNPPGLEPIHHYEQVQDLAGLLTVLEIKPPYNLIGLSYGAGIATAFAEAFPSQVKRLFLMAPYTEPLLAQDEWIKKQVATSRQMFPFNPYTDDQLYDYFLRQIIYSTYPLAEPVVMEHPLKLEAIYRMVQGIRKYNTLDSAKFFDEGSVHMMVPSKDQYIAAEVYEQFWLSLPEEVRGSYINIVGSEHKMPQAVPDFSAAWIHEVMQGGEEFSSARLFDGFPLKGEAVSGAIKIEMPKGLNNVPFSPSHAPQFKMHYEIIEGLLPRDTLFIHGNLASNNWWMPSIDAFKDLAEGAGLTGRAILAEWRGCGKSSAPASLSEVKMEDFAKDYVALLEHLGLNQKLDIVGHSTGGILALLIAGQIPKQVNSLFLLDPVGAKGVVFHESMYQAFEQMQADRDLTGQVIGSTIYQNDFSSPFFNRIIVDDAFRAVQAVGSWIVESLADFDVTEQLKNIEVPALIIHGSHDETLPISDSRALAHLLPNGEFVEWADAGHCANLENPQRFAQAAYDYFRSH